MYLDTSPNYWVSIRKKRVIFSWKTININNTNANYLTTYLTIKWKHTVSWQSMQAVRVWSLTWTANFIFTENCMYNFEKKCKKIYTILGLTCLSSEKENVKAIWQGCVVRKLEFP